MKLLKWMTRFYSMDLAFFGWARRGGDYAVDSWQPDDQEIWAPRCTSSPITAGMLMAHRVEYP